MTRELQHGGQDQRASPISEVANMQSGDGKFGNCLKGEVATRLVGVAKRKNSQAGKQSKSEVEKTVPVVDLADSSEEEKEEVQAVEKQENREVEKQTIQEEEKEEVQEVKKQEIQDASSTEQKVKDVLKLLENASREKQDEILSKMGIVRTVKKRNKQVKSNTPGQNLDDSDAGLYSDGDEDQVEANEGN